MKKWLLILIPVLVLGGLVFWRFAQKKTQAAGPMGRGMAGMRGPASVELASPQLRDIRKTFQATGNVESMQNVNISPKVSGRIEYLQVREGDRVTQGQVLVRIDQSDVQAQVRQQQAQLAEAKYRLAQAQLNQTPIDTAVTTQIRQQEANLAGARAELSQAEQTHAAQEEAIKASLDDAQSRIDNAVAAVASAEADQRLAEQTCAAQLAANSAAIEDAQSKIENVSATVANAKAGINSAQANLDNATSKYNRTYELYKKGYVSAQEVDDARTAMNVQQSSVETAKGQLQAATAALSSAQAQKRSVEQQTAIATVKADTGQDSARAKVTQTKAAMKAAMAQQRSAEQQASITRAKADADLAAARSRIEQAKAALDYARANAKQSPAFRQNLEALRAGVDVARASLDSTLAKRSDTVLRSPLDGVVTARSQDPGAMASPSQPILTVQSLNHIWISIAVPEEVCVKVHLNQPATITVDALGGKVFPARVAQVNPSADLQSRQFTVRVVLKNDKQLFSPGMFAKVTLITEQADHVLAVLLEAVKQDTDGGKYVFVQEAQQGENGRMMQVAKQQPVVAGISDANWVAVTGLLPTQKVVTMSASPLRDGQPIDTGERRRGRGQGGPGQGGGMPDGGQRQGRPGGAGAPGGSAPGGGQWRGGGGGPGGDAGGPSAGPPRDIPGGRPVGASNGAPAAGSRRGGNTEPGGAGIPASRPQRGGSGE